jgi:ribonuclease E
VLPGKDLLQPLATASGLVRSAASARAEVLSPAEGGNGRRRRGGRGRSGPDTTPVVAAAGAETVVSDENGVDDSQEDTQNTAATRRPEPELVAVPMTAEQQEVYGWLGLNPALLLETPPESDNVLVRVVSPGEDPEAVLEEARQQLAASSGRRRRRGRGGRGSGRNGQSAPVAVSEQESSVPDRVSSEAEPETAPLMVEITPLEITPQVLPEPELPSVEPEIAAIAVAEEEKPEEELEEPRRRRRRSSATASS